MDNKIEIPSFLPVGEDCGVNSDNHEEIGYLLRIMIETPLKNTCYLMSFNNEEEAKRIFKFNRDRFDKENEDKKIEVVEDGEYTYYAKLEEIELPDKGNKGIIFLKLFKILNNSGIMYSY